MASVAVGIVVAFLVSWTTTLSKTCFMRKTVAVFFLYFIYSFSISVITALKVSDIESHESGDWSPMPPEVLSAPIAMFLLAVGLLAVLLLSWLASINEVPDPK